MRTMTLVGFGMAAFALAASALGQDAQGSKDHPMVSRMPGYSIQGYDAQDFSAVDLPTDPPTHIEGRYWRIEYVMGEKKAGPLQIARNYTNLFVARGGRKIMETVDAGGGTTVAYMPASGTKMWLQVDINNSGEMYILTILEEAAMEQKVQFTEMELAKALDESGSVAMYGILFDTGKATIKPESAQVLMPVGALLKSRASLKLEIQGHTDTVGTPAANLKLSQERATAVKAYLTQTFAIGADRLTAVGFGGTRGVADNATDAGRARNRRVELVKK